MRREMLLIRGEGGTLSREGQKDGGVGAGAFSLTFCVIHLVYFSEVS